MILHYLWDDITSAEEEIGKFHNTNEECISIHQYKNNDAKIPT